MRDGLKIRISEARVMINLFTFRADSTPLTCRKSIRDETQLRIDSTQIYEKDFVDKVTNTLIDNVIIRKAEKPVKMKLRTYKK